MIHKARLSTPPRVLSLARGYPAEGDGFSLSDETVHACFRPPTTVTRGRALPLPAGRFDIRTLIKQLPGGAVPDVVLVSSTLALEDDPPVPEGLADLGCATVMKFTDSHHGHRPIERIIDYARAVGCSFHWTAYNRQHLHFYRAAGLNNPFWMPGSINIASCSIDPAPEKSPGVVFCGEINPLHAYRASLLRLLQASGVPISIGRRPYAEALKSYAQTAIAFNSSMNGDLNRRVFEVLMAGGFLLTDRLSPQSGLPLLFREGVHLDCYGSPEELLEKTNYYLRHPEAAARIAAAGHAEFTRHYHRNVLLDRLARYVLDDEPLPDVFLAKEDERSERLSDDQLRERVRFYEMCQEIHRLNGSVRVGWYNREGHRFPFAGDLADLPRLVITSAASVEPLVRSECSVVVVDFSDIATAPSLLLAELTRALGHAALIVVLNQPADWSASPLASFARRSALRPIQLRESGGARCVTFVTPRWLGSVRPGGPPPGLALPAEQLPASSRGLAGFVRAVLRRTKSAASSLSLRSPKSRES